MLRTMGNMLRAFFCIGVAGLIGYYNFGLNGWVGLATNVAFFALGFLLVSTWRNPENERSDANLEALSSKETTPTVVVVERPVETVKPLETVTETESSNSMPTTSPTDL